VLDFEGAGAVTMPRGNPNTENSDEVREAIDAVLDAMAECHNVVAASNEKVVAKIAEAARVLGWPDHVVSGVVNQIQSIAEMQIKMIDHTMEVWREQIEAWPRPGIGLMPRPLKRCRSIPSNIGRVWGNSGRRIGRRR
jgi:hypothetical protein